MNGSSPAAAAEANGNISAPPAPLAETMIRISWKSLRLPQEENFRIDVCRECNGYIKTYLSEGDEDILLADWSTLHLDVIASQQGLQRRANSLYEL